MSDTVAWDCAGLPRSSARLTLYYMQPGARLKPRGGAMLVRKWHWGCSGVGTVANLVRAQSD
jgi:hypothetical protein